MGRRNAAAELLQASRVQIGGLAAGRCVIAALTITTTAVVPGSGAVIRTAVAGEAITIGMAVYIRDSDGKLYKSDANDSSTPDNLIDGVAISTATAAGQHITYQVGGTLAFGAILTAGMLYVSGAGTAGDINPATDLTTGWYTNVIGVATSTSNMLLSPWETGAVT